jgi:hypothetical protein
MPFLFTLFRISSNSWMLSGSLDATSAPLHAIIIVVISVSANLRGALSASQSMVVGETGNPNNSMAWGTESVMLKIGQSPNGRFV